MARRARTRRSHPARRPPAPRIRPAPAVPSTPPKRGGAAAVGRALTSPERTRHAAWPAGRRAPARENRPESAVQSGRLTSLIDGAAPAAAPSGRTRIDTATSGRAQGPVLPPAVPNAPLAPVAPPPGAPRGPRRPSRRTSAATRREVAHDAVGQGGERGDRLLERQRPVGQQRVQALPGGRVDPG